MTDTTERAKLLALADRMTKRTLLELNDLNAVRDYLDADSVLHHEAASALRRLAAQDQKPPPAASWDEALRSLMKAGKIMAVCELCSSSYPEGCGHYDLDDLRETPDGAWVCENCWDESGDNPIWEYLSHVESLRATPAATKSACMGDISSGDPADLQELLSSPSVLERTPPHGGADAGVRVKSLEWHQHPDGETKRYEGVAAIGNNYAVFQAWWGVQNKWGWIGDGEFYHSEVEARQACNADYERRVLSALSHQPAPVAANASAEATYRIGRWLSAALEDPNVCAEMKSDINAWMKAGKPNIQPSGNASAEARLREALRDLVWLVSTDRTYDDSESLRSARNILFAENKAAMAALSAHPHASDCDKQGAIPSGYGEYTPITVGGSTSDRPADVTEEELHAFILKHGDEWEDEGVAARSLLDAYGMWRR